MKSVFIKVLRVLMLFIVIISCAVGYVVYEDTLASWWIPVGVALVIAILTLPLYKKWTRLTAGSDKTLNLLCHVVPRRMKKLSCRRNFRRRIRRHAG